MVLSWVTLWLVGIGAGMQSLLIYQNSPGTAGRPPETWPGIAGIDHSRDVATLLMFVHPRCPCTRASIEELARLIALRRASVLVHVVFYTPSRFKSGWEKSGLWRMALRIPGAVLSRDEDGRIARLFAVETSGHVVLYDVEGRLRFSGGITASRGHAGDNVGRTMLMRALDDRQANQLTTPVYGCPLIAPHLAGCAEAHGTCVMRRAST